jgi:hypothetical protein
MLTNRDIKESKYDAWWGPFFLDRHVKITALHENLQMLRKRPTCSSAAAELCDQACG